MRVGLTYDLKEAVQIDHSAPEDALEEYDYPATINYITRALEAQGHRIVKLGGGREFLSAILAEKVDIVFNISEGRGTFRSREAQVPSVLEMLNIPYVGSDPLCLAICLEKSLTKEIVARAGVRTPQWFVLKDLKSLSAVKWEGFNFPAILKPVYEGSSKGIRNTSLVSLPGGSLSTSCEGRLRFHKRGRADTQSAHLSVSAQKSRAYALTRSADFSKE